MLGIARLADRGPSTAAGLAAALLIGGRLSFPVIGPFAVVPITLSAAVVAFVVLRHGEASALRVGGICLAILLTASLLLLRSALAIPLIALLTWLPAIVAATVLRRSSQLGMAVLALSAISVACVLLLALGTGDPEAFWRAEMARLLNALIEQSGRQVDATHVESAIAILAFRATRAVGLSVFLSAVAPLFIARHWQATLFNPGGFRAEFHALTLGKPAAIVALASIAATSLLGGPVGAAIAMVIGAAFVLQGLAVVHALTAQRGLPGFWLFGAYLLLVIPPQGWLLLAALGLIDNHLVLRRG